MTMTHLTRLTICRLLKHTKIEQQHAFLVKLKVTRPTAILNPRQSHCYSTTTSNADPRDHGKVSAVTMLGSTNSETDNGGMKIMKESIDLSIDETPEISSSLMESLTSQTMSSPSPTTPTALSASEEYSKLPLSRDRIMVDTYSLIKVFTQKGFTVQQAECIAYTFTQLMSDALREERKLCVEKSALDVMREQVMAHIGALRKDMIILEKSELSDLRNSNEKLKLLLAQHKSQMTEDVNRVKNQLTLDINMERGRTKDEQIEVEKQVANLTTKMTAEIGHLETTFERYKNDIYKFIVGSIVSGLTIGLGLFRILKSHV